MIDTRRGKIRIVNLGFGQQDYGQLIAGAILIGALALLTELALVLLTQVLTPGPGRHALPHHVERIEDAGPGRLVVAQDLRPDLGLDVGLLDEV